MSHNRGSPAIIFKTHSVVFRICSSMELSLQRVKMCGPVDKWNASLDILCYLNTRPNSKGGRHWKSESEMSAQNVRVKAYLLVQGVGNVQTSLMRTSILRNGSCPVATLTPNCCTNGHVSIAWVPAKSSHGLRSTNGSLKCRAFRDRPTDHEGAHIEPLSAQGRPLVIYGLHP
jgi:hypothetical protein